MWAPDCLASGIGVDRNNPPGLSRCDAQQMIAGEEHDTGIQAWIDLDHMDMHRHARAHVGACVERGRNLVAGVALAIDAGQHGGRARRVNRAGRIDVGAARHRLVREGFAIDRVMRALRSQIGRVEQDHSKASAGLRNAAGCTVPLSTKGASRDFTSGNVTPAGAT